MTHQFNGESQHGFFPKDFSRVPSGRRRKPGAGFGLGRIVAGDSARKVANALPQKGIYSVEPELRLLHVNPNDEASLLTLARLYKGPGGQPAPRSDANGLRTIYGLDKDAFFAPMRVGVVGFSFRNSLTTLGHTDLSLVVKDIRIKTYEAMGPYHLLGERSVAAASAGLYSPREIETDSAKSRENVPLYHIPLGTIAVGFANFPDDVQSSTKLPETITLRGGSVITEEQNPAF